MVVEFRYAHFADVAMLGTCGFEHVACFAFIIGFIEDSIVVVVVLLDETRRGLRSHFSRRDRASFVINPKAKPCHYIGYDHVVV